jgi:hypothetical protein
MQGSDGPGKGAASQGRRTRAGEEDAGSGQAKTTGGSPAMKSGRSASLAGRSRRKGVTARGLG